VYRHFFKLVLDHHLQLNYLLMFVYQEREKKWNKKEPCISCWKILFLFCWCLGWNV